jgi:hypothetical protein
VGEHYGSIRPGRGLGPHPGQEDELGVKTVLIPHHCWKDDQIKELEKQVLHQETQHMLARYGSDEHIKALLDGQEEANADIKKLEAALSEIRSLASSMDGSALPGTYWTIWDAANRAIVGKGKP